MSHWLNNFVCLNIRYGHVFPSGGHHWQLERKKTSRKIKSPFCHHLKPCIVCHWTDFQYTPSAFVLCVSFLCSTKTLWKERQLCWRAETPARVWQGQTHMCLYPNNPTSHGSVGWLSETKHHYRLTWECTRFQQRRAETHFPFLNALHSLPCL